MLKKIFIAACLAIGGGVLVAGTASAYSILNQDTSTLGSDQVVDGPLYVAGSTVRVEGTVNGDLFCAGQTVEVTGTVNGDILCAAQQLTLKGKVNGDVRAAAQNINAENETTGSFTVFAQTLRFNETATVGRDATVFAQSATLNGGIGRDLVGGGDTVVINNSIGGATKLDVRSLTFGSNANVAAVNYTSRTDANVQQGAQVGNLTRSEPPAGRGEENPRNTFAASVASAFFWFLTALLTGGLLLLLFPRLFERTAKTIQTKPWAVLGWGLVGVLLTPVLALVLIITIIGIPLAVILFLAWVILLMTSGIFSGYALGKYLVGRLNSKTTGGWLHFSGLALGLFVLALLSVIPVVNFFSGLAAAIFGAGGLLHLLLSRRPGANATAAE